MPNTPVPAAATGLPSRRRALASLAGVGAALSLPQLAQAALPDPIIGLFAESVQLKAAMGGSEDHSNPLLAQLGEIDRKVIAARASTMPGAILSLEWARAEFVEFYADGEQGDQFILALIDGALGVLRTQGGAA